MKLLILVKNLSFLLVFFIFSSLQVSQIMANDVKSSPVDDNTKLDQKVEANSEKAEVNSNKTEVNSEQVDTKDTIDYNQEQKINIDIRDGKFFPNHIKLHNRSRIKFTITNHDSIPAEFESHKLNREKIIPAKGQTNIALPKLNPGKYEFMNDFNQDQKGIIEVYEVK